YPAHSAGGRFDARLPVPYNDLTTIAVAKDGGRLVSETIGGTSAEGARFAVNCMRRSDGKADTNWATAVAASLAAGEKGVQRRAVEQSGLRGVELRIRSDVRGLFLGRLLGGNGTLCQVSLEYRGGENADIEAAGRVFVESFRIAPLP